MSLAKVDVNELPSGDSEGASFRSPVHDPRKINLLRVGRSVPNTAAIRIPTRHLPAARHGLNDTKIIDVRAGRGLWCRGGGFLG